MAMPARTKTTETTRSAKAVPELCSASCRGSTGARNRSKAVPWDEGMPTARPATMVRMDSTISGTVITAGDS